MDFTYLVGLVLAALVGIVCQVTFLIARRERQFGLGTTFGVALALNVLLLIDWRAFSRGLTSFDAVVLVSDVVLIPMITIVGVLIGVLPFLLLVGACRKVFALCRKHAAN